MSAKRTLLERAAICGSTAVFALLTGLGTAGADELADLRANQQLLQQRIDQLAQAQAQGVVAPKPAPGVAPNRIPPEAVSPQPTAPFGTGGGGAAQTLGYKAAPGIPTGGGSFPRSFLIPGTDTSLRIGGFVDLTSLYFVTGGGGANGSNYSSNAGQNGANNSLPLRGGFVPGLGFVPSQVNTHPSRNNGIWVATPQQTRTDIETRTPTSYGEARTFFSFDWAGCDNFSCQSVVQGGGDSIHPRLRFAYGTLGGFLAGQALSNFSDADADTENLSFGGSIGGTGGNRIPQVRYTVPGPYGSAFSVSAEQPWTSVLTPGGGQSSDLNTALVATTTSPPTGVVGPICNGGPCTGAGGPQTNPTTTKAPSLTFTSYWAQPWGHVDVGAILRFQTFHDGGFINETFVGYGGHFSGDVHPGWPGYRKDDFLWTFIAGEALGPYASGGLNTMFPVGTNFTVPTRCATPTPTCTGGAAASNVLFSPVMAFSVNGGYQHWWLPNLRSTIAAGFARQDPNSKLLGPQETVNVNKILWNTFINLVWNPVAFITTGVEYMYGRRFVVSNAHGTEQAFVYKWRVAF
jgi:hypothetical protein